MLEDLGHNLVALQSDNISPSLEPLIEATRGRDVVLAGDFNAEHMEWWSSCCTSKPCRSRMNRGAALVESMMGYNLDCINPPDPTHVSASSGSSSILDLVYVQARPFGS